MRAFFETTFGPDELEVLEDALAHWREAHCVDRDDPVSELAGAIMITLFREGQRTLPDLLYAASRHKGLCDLAGPARQS
ncbi:hypothetical protein ACRQ1B_16960 [Rhizobium panacihumi]|uniref:hypothetical protein n=1 Tax=Rhizobium panacihumi TaxID=2008450 RepID=UPI003D78D8BD